LKLAFSGRFLERIFLKVKFGEILNTKVAPKIMLNSSR
jgi:hypothetical protein